MRERERERLIDTPSTLQLIPLAHMYITVDTPSTLQLIPLAHMYIAVDTPSIHVHHS